MEGFFSFTKPDQLLLFFRLPIDSTRRKRAVGQNGWRHRVDEDEGTLLCFAIVQNEIDEALQRDECFDFVASRVVSDGRSSLEIPVVHDFFGRGTSMRCFCHYAALPKIERFDSSFSIAFFRQKMKKVALPSKGIVHER